MPAAVQKLEAAAQACRLLHYQGPERLHVLASAVATKRGACRGALKDAGGVRTFEGANDVTQRGATLEIVEDNDLVGLLLMPSVVVGRKVVLLALEGGEGEDCVHIPNEPRHIAPQPLSLQSLAEVHAARLRALHKPASMGHNEHVIETATVETTGPCSVGTTEQGLEAICAEDPQQHRRDVAVRCPGDLGRVAVHDQTTAGLRHLADLKHWWRGATTSARWPL
mmetsp:Transcript_93185/g.199919  ORF Transcript_93185/g.199919 Transcript_93185/m.199919 type:complete len:224 (+) Transcript_93185:1365-2036(+)